jgi:hypothetical protein
MEAAEARVIWRGLEHLHAVTYFAPECRDAPAAIGLRGFWRGYFAGRAAPMGAVPSGVVEATFFNFHPTMVRKAVPAVWDVAPPSELVRSRATAAAAALRRMVPDAEQVAGDLMPLLEPCIEAADGAGRPLFSANRQVARPDDPVEAAWQMTTTLREHRGDGHVSLLTAEGFDGCEAHVLFAAIAGLPVELLLNARGWSMDEWAEAAERLVARGLLNPDGTPTADGVALRNGIEARTDQLAAGAYRTLRDDQVDRIVEIASRAAQAIASTDLIPYPNPMGLPAPS